MSFVLVTTHATPVPKDVAVKVFTCATCKAKPGKPCVTLGKRTPRTPHAARLLAAVESIAAAE